MLWHKLSHIEELNTIQNLSKEDFIKGVLIFKHSTRCSISSMALNRLESKWNDDKQIPTYYLDLLSFREISNEIANMYSVEHASPQVLLIKNGKCFYHASHTAISASSIMTEINGQ